MPFLAIPPRGIARAAAIAALSLVAAACSSNQAANTQGYAGATQVPAPPQRVAARDAYVPEPGDPIKQAPVEPVSRRSNEPDDPTEPFSPNYGKAPATQTSPAPVGRIRVSDASAD
jgi:hypothetical protein